MTSSTPAPSRGSSRRSWRACSKTGTTGHYDPAASLDMDEAERHVLDAQRIVDAVAWHLGH